MSQETDPRHRRIRSFVLRAGRMTDAQQRGFDEGWPKWGIDYTPELLDFDAIFGVSPDGIPGETGERVLEIGFGMGQSLVEMAAAFPISSTWASRSTGRASANYFMTSMSAAWKTSGSCVTTL